MTGSESIEEIRIWLIDDELSHRRMAEVILKRGYPKAVTEGFSDFGAAWSAVEAVGVGGRPAPDLVVLDLLLGLGDHSAVIESPLNAGRRVYDSIRSKSQMAETAVIIRTANPDLFGALANSDSWCRLVTKGSSPTSFLAVASSLLRSKNFPEARALQEVEGELLPSDGLGFSVATRLMATAAASSAWAATILQVTSSSDERVNSVLIAFAGLGGLSIAGGRQFRGGARAMMQALGLAICFCSAFVGPRVW